MILGVREATTTWVWRAPEPEDVAIPPNALGITPLSVSDYLLAASRGLSSALDERNVPNLRLDFHDNSPEMHGKTLMTLMLLTHAAALALDVNVFDQPAVELAKRMTRAEVERLAGRST